MKTRSRIEIDFGVAVPLSGQFEQKLVELLHTVCKAYTTEHPDRVMWVFGVGSRMMVNPLALSDDEPIPFNDDILHFEIAERENYDWLCVNCGLKQGDHATCITQPPAGACEYVPVPRVGV